MNRLDGYKGNYGTGFSFFGLSIDFKTVLLVFFAASLVAISVFGVSTGNYIKTLEMNATSLESKLSSCYVQYNNTSAVLDACAANLDSKTSSNARCQSQLSTITDSLSSCQTDLGGCQSDFRELRYSLADYSIKFSNCQADLNAASSAQVNYNTLKDNYAKDYCCTLNNVTSGQRAYYKMENNKITCFSSSTANTVAITC